MISIKISWTVNYSSCMQINRYTSRFLVDIYNIYIFLNIWIFLFTRFTLIYVINIYSSYEINTPIHNGFYSICVQKRKQSENLY